MVGMNFTLVNQTDEQFQWRVIGLTAATSVISALLSWLVLGRVLRPVRRLAAATDTSPRPGSVRPAATRRPDEVGRLTRSFTTMLTALRRSRDQQRRLIQDASHELGTPLTSVRASAELLQRAHGKLDSADEQQILATLVSESARSATWCQNSSNSPPTGT